MNAFRVASYADSNYKVAEFQGSFSVILEPNEMLLYILLSISLSCQHAMKVMLATTSPATVHSVAARWLIHSIPQHLPHGLQAVGEDEKDPLIVPLALPSIVKCGDTGQFLEKRLQQAVFVQLCHLRTCRRRGVALALVEAAEQACDLLNSKISRFQKIAIKSSVVDMPIAKKEVESLKLQDSNNLTKRRSKNWYLTNLQ